MAIENTFRQTIYILELIEKRKTGTPKQLAHKLGVTERGVYYIMNSIRDIADQQIAYSKELKSYIYVKNK